MSDSLRDRIAAVQSAHDQKLAWGCKCGWEYDPLIDDSHFDHVADAVIEALPVIKALPQQVEWRADFGYDGYAKCETRDEARARVDEFNAALGDDIRDGEQAMVIHRYVSEWTADA
jgi:hypothetical protein